MGRLLYPSGRAAGFAELLLRQLKSRIVGKFEVENGGRGGGALIGGKNENV